jgi:hypothetical protein
MCLVAAHPVRQVKVYTLEGILCGRHRSVKNNDMWCNTYLFTYSMEQSFLRIEPICSYSRNSPHFMEPEGSLPHSQLPPTVSILSQPNPVYIPTFHFLKVHPNIILPPTPGSPQWSLSLRFPHQNLIHASVLPHPPYMPCPSNSTHH